MLELVLAYETLKDPRDLAEVLHLAIGFGARVQLIGKSLDPRHWKVLRKLKSWRPRLAENADQIDVDRFESVDAWAEAMRSQRFSIAATVLEGGKLPWSASAAKRTAILFGEESHGLSKEAVALASELWTLPLGPGGKFYTIGQATALVLGGATF